MDFYKSFTWEHDIKKYTHRRTSPTFKIHENHNTEKTRCIIDLSQTQTRAKLDNTKKKNCLNERYTSLEHTKKRHKELRRIMYMVLDAILVGYWDVIISEDIQFAWLIYEIYTICLAYN